MNETIDAILNAILKRKAIIVDTVDGMPLCVHGVPTAIKEQAGNLIIEFDNGSTIHLYKKGTTEVNVRLVQRPDKFMVHLGDYVTFESYGGRQLCKVCQSSMNTIALICMPGGNRWFDSVGHFFAVNEQFDLLSLFPGLKQFKSSLTKVDVTVSINEDVK